jgi:Family of unknown function (DUF5908)
LSVPIVVDEVVISIEVTNAAAGGASPPEPTDDKQQLVEECAQRVLEILRDGREP